MFLPSAACAKCGRFMRVSDTKSMSMSMSVYVHLCEFFFNTNGVPLKQVCPRKVITFVSCTVAGLPPCASRLETERQSLSAKSF